MKPKRPSLPFMGEETKKFKLADLTFGKALGITAWFIIPIVNLVLFAFWVFINTPSLKPVCCGNQDFIDLVQLQIMMIEVTILLVSIVLVVLGLFGYQNVKQAAEMAAAESADKVAQDKARSIAAETAARVVEQMFESRTGLSPYGSPCCPCVRIVSPPYRKGLAKASPDKKRQSWCKQGG